MLSDNHISLIPLEERHLEPLRQLRNHPQTWYYLTSVFPLNEKGQLSWFENLCRDRNRMYFAIEKKGQFVGMVRSDEWDSINQSIRIGVDIVPARRRKGIAARSYKLLLNYLFNQLNIHRVWLLAAEFNKPTIVLYKKLGFKKEGVQRQALWRDGQWRNYIMMSLLRKEYQKQSQKII